MGLGLADPNNNAMVKGLQTSATFAALLSPANYSNTGSAIMSIGLWTGDKYLVAPVASQHPHYFGLFGV